MKRCGVSGLLEQPRVATPTPYDNDMMDTPGGYCHERSGMVSIERVNLRLSNEESLSFRRYDNVSLIKYTNSSRDDCPNPTALL